MLNNFYAKLKPLLGSHWGTVMLLGLALFLSFLISIPFLGESSQEPNIVDPIIRTPNIIVIFADDLGYADVSLNGSKEIATPNIDSIANAGVRFTDGYVSASTCSPSRAGLMTGRNQNKYGYISNPDRVVPRDPVMKPGLPLSEVTLAEVLRELGYVTGIIGKWHLGKALEYHPVNRGFDEFFGFLGNPRRYFPTENSKLQDEYPLMRGMEIISEPEYLTDAFTREAVEFIEKNAQRKFFLYLPYNAVHSPLAAKENKLKKVSTALSGNRRIYAAMVDSLDEGVGAILAVLNTLGIEQNTVVFFIGDNGGSASLGAASNLPLRGYKGELYEGGVRVPFVMQWPGTIAEGTVYTRPVSALDVFPTAVAMAGGTLPTDRDHDGVNLLPYLTGESTDAPHSVLFWRRFSQYSMRTDKWKLIRFPKGEVELYDLSQDVGETVDQSSRHPERAAELLEQLENWERRLSPPLWDPDPNFRKKKVKKEI